LATNKKEGLQFGLMMCFGMVLLMTLYNFYLNGMFGNITFIAGLSDFVIGFIIALMLDLFIVGPNAKKIAFKLIGHTNNKIYTILAISTCMVLGMAFFMSMYGMAISYFHNGFDSTSIISSYFSVFGKNLLLALPLQILVMGPLVRFLFIACIQSKTKIENA